jgi:uncharacterized protein YjiS (DUF1127 family)
MTPFKTAAKRVGGAFRAIANEIRFRNEIRALHELDDRMLEDIGFVRGSIEYEVRNGRTTVGP